MSDPTELTEEQAAELAGHILEMIPLHISGTGTVTLPDGTIPQEEN